MKKEIWWFFEYGSYKFNKNNSYVAFLKKFLIITWKKYNFYLDWRNAIFDLIKNLWNKEKYLLPAYLCESILEPFDKLWYNYDFYSIFDKKYLLNSKWNIIFVINYFWEQFLTEEELNFLLKDNKIIVDISHDIFNSKLIKNSHKDLYIVASLRKLLPLYWWWLVISDFIEFKSNLSSNNENLIKAGLLKKKYLENKISDKKFLEIYNVEEEKRKNNISWQNISEIDFKLLNYIDIEGIILKRKRNFKYLYNKILTFKKELLFQKGDNNYSYLILKLNSEKERNNLKNFFIKNNIFTPVHWELPKKIKELNFKKEIELSKKLLTIPIDHRYWIEEMDYIFKVLKKFYNYE